MKIYLVEDDSTILSLLKSHLEKDYQVAAVSNFRDIKNEILDFEPDLILMDITLPFFNGFYWTSEIRKQSTVPIIFISSSNDEMDAVMALNMGGDDYITKPFSLTILDAKIAAFLRRATQFAADCFSYKDYQLHFDSILSKGEQKISLSPTEHKILSLFFSKQGTIVSKEDLLKSLWDNDQFIDQNTLNVNMTRLRKKLLDIDFDYIHTVRGVGYILK
ncbi:response regulator protein [Streptococcus porcinus]|nr:response regulator protein [Streptococcus porcinus]